MTAEDVLRFWFADAATDDAELERHATRWFHADAAFDSLVVRAFAGAIDRAGKGELDEWARGPRGRLALIILLDQLTRNAFRGSAKAYAYDHRAARLCRDGIAIGADRGLAAVERVFFYLPLLHSERLADQRLGVARFVHLLAQAPAHQNRYFAAWVALGRRHRAIIRFFGRFPHRNAVLGRRSSVAERTFLALARARAAMAGR